MKFFLKVLTPITIAPALMILLALLSSPATAAKNFPGALKVSAEGVSYRLEDETELKGKALDMSLAEAVNSAYETLIAAGINEPDPDADTRVLLSSPLNYILSYRVLSDGWITHLVVPSSMKLPPRPPVEVEPNDAMTLEDGPIFGSKTNSTDDLETTGIGQPGQGIELYHVWIEADVDLESLRNDLFITARFASENTSLLTILLIDIKDYGEYEKIRDAVSAVDIVKEVYADSFSKGKIVLTAEVWGNPYMLMEKLTVIKNTGDYALIPAGQEKIVIKAGKRGRY